MKGARQTRRWAASSVIAHFLAGQSLVTITCQSHASRGKQHPLFWITSGPGEAALKQNEDTLRRWMRRTLRPRRVGRAA